jgi:hypothetical protein
VYRLEQVLEDAAQALAREEFPARIAAAKAGLSTGGDTDVE